MNTLVMPHQGGAPRWRGACLWWVAMVLLPTFSSANLNLYLTNAEVRRILGLKAELFYVREGVVNEYAMSWTVPVAADVHALHFTWRATDNTPLLYNMAVWTSDTENTDAPADAQQDDRLDKKKPTRKKKKGDQGVADGGSGSPGGKGTAPVVLAPPYVNVSLAGTVPMEPSTFTLHLPCTGAASAEVDVTLNINVTAPRPNQPPTELYFRRRKICLEGQSSGAFAPHQDPLEEEDEGRPPLTAPLYYGLCGVGAGTLVILALLGAAFVRRRLTEKRHRDHCTLTSNCGSDQKSRAGTSSSLLSPSSNNVYTPTNHTYTPSTHTYTLPSPATSNCYASLTQLPVSPPPQTLPRPPTQTLPRPPTALSRPPTSASLSRGGLVASASLSRDCTPSSLSRDCALTSLSRDCTLTTMASVGGDSWDSAPSGRELLVDPCTAQLQENFKHLQVERRRVRLTCVLIEGRYGRLYRGCIQADAPHPDTQVLVKTVQGSAPQQQVRQLCRAGVRLAALQHRAVLPLAAMSLGAAVPPLLIFPDLGFHNLKLFLRGRGVHLTPGDLQQVALQAAQGLAFLHSCNILHTDLAARNCVITDQLQLRLSDTALSSDLFPDDYQQGPVPPGGEGGAGSRPLAWLALEAITEGVTSQPCDVWSWGVLAWELSTLAQQPYQDLAMAHLAEYLRDGYRLAQPATCPDVLYQLMAFCWAINPQHRPRAALLVEYLTGLNQQPSSTFGGGTTTSSCSSLAADTQTSNHIPASSFLHNSASIGTDLKRLNHGSHPCLMNTSVSMGGGDLKGITHQFHSHSLNPACSGISKSDLKGLSQLAQLYSQPTEEEDLVGPHGGVSVPAVYSTPTSIAGGMAWRMPPYRLPNGAISVPPPLPPANGTLPPIRVPRPQQPLPEPTTAIIL